MKKLREYGRVFIVWGRAFCFLFVFSFCGGLGAGIVFVGVGGVGGESERWGWFFNLSFSRVCGFFVVVFRFSGGEWGI